MDADLSHCQLHHFPFVPHSRVYNEWINELMCTHSAFRLTKIGRYGDTGRYLSTCDTVYMFQYLHPAACGLRLTLQRRRICQPIFPELVNRGGFATLLARMLHPSYHLSSVPCLLEAEQVSREFFIHEHHRVRLQSSCGSGSMHNSRLTPLDPPLTSRVPMHDEDLFQLSRGSRPIV